MHRKDADPVMESREELFLKEYDPSQFERPSVTVDILIFTVFQRKLHLLLVMRRAYPFLGKWALPGGFLRMDESAEEAAARILSEKAGVSGVHLEQLYTFSSVDRDPRTRILSIAFLAAVPFGKLRFAAGENAASASLFAVDGVTGEGIDTGSEGAFSYKSGELKLTGPDGEEINGADLAFDHEMIIRTAVLRMRGKIDYTDLAFGFLEDPSAFSLTELRHVYEAVMDCRLDIGNFRRTIKREYEKTGRITEQGPVKGAVGRPAMLYGFTGKNVRPHS